MSKFEDTNDIKDIEDILITKKQIDTYLSQRGLKRVLIPRLLWGMGVGSVISGQYFGWNYGLAFAGPGGFLITTAIVTLLYILIVILLSRLSASLPYAGGPYAFARKGLGPMAGFIAGISAILEFLFAASAIAVSIGSYLNYILPGIPSLLAAVPSFLLLILFNVAGLKKSAILQITVTCLSLGGIILFISQGVVAADLTEFHAYQMFQFGLKGICTAFPFAIWFYICIEGLAMTGEETQNPSKSVPLGFLTSIITLIAASFSILIIALGTVNLHELDGINYPLSYIIEKISKGTSTPVILFTFLTLAALLASLHGIINSYSRQTFSLARAGYLPNFLSRISKVTKTPYLSIVLPGIAGILLSCIVSIEALIVLSSFCGLVMHFFVIVSFIKLSRGSTKNGQKGRFPVVAPVALLLTAIILVSLLLTDIKRIVVLLVTYAGIMLYYHFFARSRIKEDAPEELESKPDEVRVTIHD